MKKTSLFGASALSLLLSTSPVQASENGKSSNTIDSVKHSVQQFIFLQEKLPKESMEGNDSDDILLRLSQLPIKSILEESFGPFHESHQEMLAFVTPIVEQSVHEAGTATQEYSGYLQISKNHIKELWDVARNENIEGRGRLIAIIKLFSIVWLHSALPTVYGFTVYNTFKGKKTPSSLFGGFAISNFLGAAGLYLGGMPLEGGGYSVATIGATMTFFILRYHENNCLFNESFMEHMQQYTAFSVYDLERKALYFSPKLLEKLGYSKEEVFAYQKEHGEIITLFYPDTQEQERIRAYQSELEENEQAYEATFFPRAKDGKKMAFRYNTVPRRDKKRRIIGTYRFAEDITSEFMSSNKADVDLLTGESDKSGFEKNFHKILLGNNQNTHRRSDDIVPKEKILTIVYLDIDSFKKINDIYSHKNADVLLKELSKICRHHLREEDIIARLGGDEFGIICNHANKLVIWEKIDAARDVFARSTFEIEKGALVKDGHKIHSSLREAIEYNSMRNAEIQQEKENLGLIYSPHARCCIGGVGMSSGIVDFMYGDKIYRKEEIEKILVELEQQSESVMSLIKYLDALGIGSKTRKNGSGIPILDNSGNIVGTRIKNTEGEFRLDKTELQRALVLKNKEVERTMENR